MKKFIISVLTMSVFFVGLGSLVEKTTANFKSDAQALELIRKARIAIGGEANIKNVRSLTLEANTTNFFEKDGIVRNEAGNLEIALEMPNRFSKRLQIGNADETAGDAEVRKEVEVIVMKSGDKPRDFNPENAGDGKKKVMIFKGDGGENVEDVEAGDGNKIIIKKDDGTTEEIKTDGKQKVIIKKDADGKVLTEDVAGDQKIVIKKDVKVVANEMRQNEMLRTTLALLLTAPEDIDVGYFYKGETTVDGFSVNIVEVQTSGSSIKLYLDKSSNLPKMIGFMGMNFPQLIKFDKTVGDFPNKVIMETGDFGGSAEHQIKFSDYRSVGGLLLPYTWTETVGGKQSQNVNVTSYEINPADIADKFKDTKVFVRKNKDR